MILRKILDTMKNLRILFLKNSYNNTTNSCVTNTGLIFSYFKIKLKCLKMINFYYFNIS